MSPNINHRHISSMESSLEMSRGLFFLQLTSQEYTISLNEWIISYNMAGFKDICCDILSWVCRDRHCMQWQIFKIQQFCMHTGSVTFSYLRWYKLFIDEWRQNILQVFIFVFVIQFAKSAKIKTSWKISTYTVY